MKKHLAILLSIFVLCVCIIMLLNIKVTTREGVDYQWYTVKIPLYLKVLNFYDRHFNYKDLVKRIIKDAKSREERVMKLFEWTCKNIKRAPQGLPIKDDHVWYIIVRGYGVQDQLSDVFTTLCNYAGSDAFFKWVYKGEQKKGAMPLSFVKIEGKWTVFDPYYGIYFKNKNGEIADIEEIKSGNTWTIESLDGKPPIDYAAYLVNLPTIKDVELNRANVQSPLNRLLFELKKRKQQFTKGKPQ